LPAGSAWRKFQPGAQEAEERSDARDPPPMLARRLKEAIALKQDREAPMRDVRRTSAFGFARAEIADEMRRRLELARQVPERPEGNGPTSSLKVARRCAVRATIGASSRTRG